MNCIINCKIIIRNKLTYNKLQNSKNVQIRDTAWMILMATIRIQNDSDIYKCTINVEVIVNEKIDDFIEEAFGIKKDEKLLQENVENLI